MAHGDDAQASRFESAGSVPRMSLSKLAFVRIPYLLCGTLLLAAIVINFANIVGRYVFAAPIFWAEEVLVYIIIWGVFISAASISYAGSHLSMDLFVINARPAYRKFLGLLVVALTVASACFVVTQTSRILALYARTGEVSMGAHVPLVLTHSAVLVGFVLMGLAALLRVRAYFTNTFD